MIERLQKIKLLLLDVDGVLTDGSVIYSDSGEELKRFHVRDGAGIKLWQRTGREVAILSGRASPAVQRRAKELGIDTVLQGRENKLLALNEVLQLTGCELNQVAAMGDDLPDVPVLRQVGLALTVADGCAEVQAIAHFKTTLPGGQGAVREAIEWMLKQLDEWDQRTA